MTTNKLDPAKVHSGAQSMPRSSLLSLYVEVLASLDIYIVILARTNLECQRVKLNRHQYS